MILFQLIIPPALIFPIRRRRRAAAAEGGGRRKISPLVRSYKGEMFPTAPRSRNPIFRSKRSFA